MPKNLEDLVVLCREPNRKEKLKSISKEAIADILEKANVDAGVSQLRTEMDELKTMMAVFMDEMKRMRQSNEDVVRAMGRIDELETELKVVKESHSKMQQAMMNQQLFLESVDAEKRKCKLVVLGLGEEADGLGDDDQSKLNSTLQAIGVPTSVLEGANLKRLGAASAQNKRRPLLMELTSAADTRRIMERAASLKSFAGQHSGLLRKVFFKRDMHPAWRKEHDRLFKLAREEKRKPENAGIEIRYDKKKRVLTRNGLVVDRFNPGFL